MASNQQNQPAEAGDSLPIIEPGHTFGSITDKISSIVLTGRTPHGFGTWASDSHFILVLGLFFCIAAVITIGVGLFGIMIPVGVGIRYRQFRLVDRHRPRRDADFSDSLAVAAKVAQSINRFAEAMTLFAVACAGLFPLIHLGRPWYFYWLVPYPSTMGIQPQFRSPLVWDVFAVSTYFTVSLLFWFLGLIPDLATLRDRARAAHSALHLRHARHGLARLGDSLASLRNGLFAFGRLGDAARGFGSHGGQL